MTKRDGKTILIGPSLNDILRQTRWTDLVKLSTYVLCFLWVIQEKCFQMPSLLLCTPHRHLVAKSGSNMLKLLLPFVNRD